MIKGVDNDIKNFCQLISKINEINTKLDIENEDFYYYGGHEFEDVYQSDISELETYQIELKEYLKSIVS